MAGRFCIGFLFLTEGVLCAVKQRAEEVTFIREPILFAMSCTFGFYLVI